MKNDKTVSKEERAAMAKGANKATDKRVSDRKSYREIQKEMFDDAKKNLPQVVADKKKDLFEKTEAYMEKHGLQNLPYTKLMEIMSSGNAYNRTRYSATEMAVLFEYYKEIVSDISTKIPKHVPTLKAFCGFIGISQATYNNYGESDDPEMVDVIQKANDYFIDVALNMAINNIVNPVPVMFMMKSIHGLVEAKEPTTIIHEDKVSIENTRERLQAIRNASVVVDAEYKDR